MAFNGSADISGQLIGQGLAQAGQALGEGLRAYQQNKATSQALDAFVESLNPQDLSNMGWDSKTLAKFSASGANAKSQMLGQGIGMMKLRQEQTRTDATVAGEKQKTAYYQQMAQQRQAELNKDDALAAALAEIGGQATPTWLEGAMANAPGQSAGGAASREQAYRTIAKYAPQMGGERAQSAMGALDKIFGEGGEMYKPKEYVDAQGNPWVIYGHTIQASPRRSDISSQAVEITDAQGNPTGKLRVPTGKDRFAVVSKAPNGQEVSAVAEPVVDAKGNPTGQMRVPNGKGGYRYFKEDITRTAEDAPKTDGDKVGFFRNVFNGIASQFMLPPYAGGAARVQNAPASPAEQSGASPAADYEWNGGLKPLK